MTVSLWVILSFAFTVTCAIIAGVWKLSATLTDLKCDVKTILTNHLPHIDARLQSIEKFLRKDEHE